MSRCALRPTQPPIHGVLRTLSPELKQPMHEADHSPATSAGVLRMHEVLPPCPYTPSCHGAWAQGQLYLYTYIQYFQCIRVIPSHKQDELHA